MQTISIYALTVRTADYKDYDKMVTVISPEHGKLDIIARGVRRQNSRNSSSVQPFCYSSMVLNVKNARYSLKESDAKECFFGLSQSLEKLNCGYGVTYCLLNSVQEGQECGEVFQLAYCTLSYICYSQAHCVDLFICFLLKFMALNGIAPATTRCAICKKSTYQNPKFDYISGALCCECKSYSFDDVAPITLEAMRRMMNLQLGKMDKVVLPQEVRNECAKLILKYFSHHFDCSEKPIERAFNFPI